MAQVSNIYITTAVASRIDRLDLRPPQPEPAASEPAEMDVLIKKLARDRCLVVTAPDGRKWRIKTGGDVIIVDYDLGGLWHPLNRGWGFNGELDQFDQARVILGQIFIGTRTSGWSLINLDCGFVISDGKPPGHGGQNIL